MVARRVVGSLLVSAMLVAVLVGVSYQVARRRTGAFFTGTIVRQLQPRVSLEVHLGRVEPPWGHGELALVLWKGQACLYDNCAFASEILLSAAGEIVAEHASDLCRPTSDRMTIAGLSPGQRLVLLIHSRGCFHDDHTRLLFAPTPGGDVSVQVQSWGSRSSALRTRSLSRDQVLSIDRELDIARIARDHGCTTRTSYSLVLEEDGRTVTTDDFVDGSCSVHLLHRGEMTLHRLAFE